MPVQVGNPRSELGDLFRVEGMADDDAVILEGTCGRSAGSGQGMGAGTLTIRGDAGPTSSAPRWPAGSIEVEGRVGDWAGPRCGGGGSASRRGGRITWGGPTPGVGRDARGVILVEGDVGDDAGLAMRRGLIAVAGRRGPAWAAA